jgi:hypothetical protein
MTEENSKLGTGPSFAQFLNGSFATVQRKTKQTALKWAAQYRKDRTFPKFAEARVEQGSTIPTNELSDLARTSTLWRVYFVRALGSGIMQALQWQDYERVASVFEEWVRQFSWGALDLALGHVAPNSLHNVAGRLEAMVGFWLQLDMLRYLDRDATRPLTLGEIIEVHYNLLIDQWLPGAKADSPETILKAVDAMRRASPADVDTRVKNLIIRLAETDQRIKNRDAFSDAVRFSALWSEALTEKEREDLTGFHIGALRRALYILDEAAGKPQPS